MNINFKKNNADRLLNNTFIFDDPWAMEATNIPYTFKGNIDWNINPFGDPEWTYMLSRNDFVLDLAYVGDYFNKSKYLYKSKYFIFDFIQNSQCIEKNFNTSWRSLDSSIRVKNWIKSYRILNKYKILDDNEKAILNQSINNHIAYLSKIDTSFTRMSNWGIIGDSGLFCAALFMNDKKNILLSYNRLIKQINNQIDEDGFHWEQSPMYHVEVLISLLDVIEEAKKYNYSLNSKIINIAKLMSYAVIKTQKPNHHQIMQGDSDDTDIRDILSRSALLLNNGLIKYFANEEISYPYNNLKIKAYKEIKIRKPNFTSIALNDSGNYYLRSGWDKNDSLIHFSCGSLGSGHGHSNLLHFDFFSNNEDIIVDSGRYTYTECEERYQLKSTYLHNSILIDDIDYFKVKDSWGYESKGTFIKGNFIEKGPFKFVNSFNTSYININGSLIERKIISLNKNLFLVFDIITTKGKHKITRYFHFDNKGILSNEKNIIKYKKKNLNTYIYFEKDSNINEIKTLYSKKYNEIETKPTLKIEDTIENETSLLTVINVNDYKIEIKEEPVESMQYNTVFNKKEVRAFSIKSDKDKYTIIFELTQCNNGVDLFKVNQLMGFGKTIIFHNKKLYKIET